MPSQETPRTDSGAASDAHSPPGSPLPDNGASPPTVVGWPGDSSPAAPAVPAVGLKTLPFSGPTHAGGAAPANEPEGRLAAIASMEAFLGMRPASGETTAGFDASR